MRINVDRRLKEVIFLSCLLGMILNLTLDLHSGPELSLAEKVFNSDLIVELHWEGVEKSLATSGSIKKEDLRIENVLKPLPDGKEFTLPVEVFVFTRGSSCWREARQNKALNFVVFFKTRNCGGLSQMAGVELDRGHYCSLNPDYCKLLASIKEALSWREERMRAVDAAQLWQAQRSVLKSNDNPYAVHLALHFLRQHQGEEVIAAEWNQSDLRKAAQKENELRMFFGRTVCHKF